MNLSHAWNRCKGNDQKRKETTKSTNLKTRYDRFCLLTCDNTKNVEKATPLQECKIWKDFYIIYNIYFSSQNCLLVAPHHTIDLFSCAVVIPDRLVQSQKLEKLLKPKNFLQFLIGMYANPDRNRIKLVFIFSVLVSSRWKFGKCLTATKRSVTLVHERLGCFSSSSWRQFGVRITT